MPCMWISRLDARGAEWLASSCTAERKGFLLQMFMRVLSAHCPCLCALGQECVLRFIQRCCMV